MFKTLTFLLFLTTTAYSRPSNDAVYNFDASGLKRFEKLFENLPKNVVTVPDNCPDGQALVNGVCRDIWRTLLSVLINLPKTPSNVVSVPDNCSSGQILINGVCRDIWRNLNQADSPTNSIVVPDNCQTGQQLVNGVCRDIWKTVHPLTMNHDVQNVVTVPPNCPEGQELVNGVCRDIWKRNNINIQEEVSSSRNIIGVPSQCPAGYRPDANGVCRQILQGRSGF